VFQKPAWCGWEVTADERLKNSSLQDESRAFSTWTPEMREWYEGLMVGDGVSIYPQPNLSKKQKSMENPQRKGRVVLGKNSVLYIIHTCKLYFCIGEKCFPQSLL
jgi:hypothetical protein